MLGFNRSRKRQGGLAEPKGYLVPDVVYKISALEAWEGMGEPHWRQCDNQECGGGWYEVAKKVEMEAVVEVAQPVDGMLGYMVTVTESPWLCRFCNAAALAAPLAHPQPTPSDATTSAHTQLSLSQENTTPGEADAAATLATLLQHIPDQTLVSTELQPTPDQPTPSALPSPMAGQDSASALLPPSTRHRKQDSPSKALQASHPKQDTTSALPQPTPDQPAASALLLPAPGQDTAQVPLCDWCRSKELTRCDTNLHQGESWTPQQLGHGKHLGAGGSTEAGGEAAYTVASGGRPPLHWRFGMKTKRNETVPYRICRVRNPATGCDFWIDRPSKFCDHLKSCISCRSIENWKHLYAEEHMPASGDVKLVPNLAFSDIFPKNDEIHQMTCRVHVNLAKYILGEITESQPVEGALDVHTGGQAGGENFASVFNMLGDEQLNLMKKYAHFVVTTRGKKVPKSPKDNARHMYTGDHPAGSGDEELVLLAAKERKKKKMRGDGSLEMPGPTPEAAATAEALLQQHQHQHQQKSTHSAGPLSGWSGSLALGTMDELYGSDDLSPEDDSPRPSPGGLAGGWERYLAAERESVLTGRDLAFLRSLDPPRFRLNHSPSHPIHGPTPAPPNVNAAPSNPTPTHTLSSPNPGPTPSHPNSTHTPSLHVPPSATPLSGPLTSHTPTTKPDPDADHDPEPSQGPHPTSGTGARPDSAPRPMSSTGPRLEATVIDLTQPDTLLASTTPQATSNASPAFRALSPAGPASPSALETRKQGGPLGTPSWLQTRPQQKSAAAQAGLHSPRQRSAGLSPSSPPPHPLRQQAQAAKPGHAAQARGAAEGSGAAPAWQAPHTQAAAGGNPTSPASNATHPQAAAAAAAAENKQVSLRLLDPHAHAAAAAAAAENKQVSLALHDPRTQAAHAAAAAENNQVSLALHDPRAQAAAAGENSQVSLALHNPRAQAAGAGENNQPDLMQQEIEARLRRQMALKDAQVQIKNLEQGNEVQRMQIRALAQQVEAIAADAAEQSDVAHVLQARQATEIGMLNMQLCRCEGVIEAERHAHEQEKALSETRIRELQEAKDAQERVQAQQMATICSLERNLLAQSQRR